MQKMKRVFLLSLIFAIMFAIVGCGSTNSNDNKASDELQIFNTDLKLTQEQML